MENMGGKDEEDEEENKKEIGKEKRGTRREKK